MADSNLSKDDIYSMSDDEFANKISALMAEGQRDDDSGFDFNVNKEPEPTIDNEPKKDDNSPNDEPFLGDNPDDGMQAQPDPQGDSNIDPNQIDDPIDDDVKDPEEEPKEQKFRVKANGQYFDLTQEDLVKLAPKGLGYTRKMQQIAPFRRVISAMEENGLTEDDINQLIEMKKGNKEATANFLQKHQITPFELDVTSEQTSNYKPQKYGTEQSLLKDAIEEAEQSPKFGVLKKYVQTFDEDSRKKVIENPNIISLLMQDIENGIFDQILPEANKRHFLEGKAGVLDYYIQVATEQLNQMKQGEKVVQQAADSKARSNARNKAQISGKKAVKVPPAKVAEQISDITDESFEAWMKSIGMELTY